MPDSTGQLAGKVALVTGGGRGIGMEMAEWFASAGANVVLVSRSLAEVELVAKRIAGTHRVDTIARVCDVRDSEGVQLLVNQVTERMGGVDIAVANAAVLGPVGTLTTTDPSRWRDTLLTNVAGTMNLARAVVPMMEARGWGRIITMSGGGMGGPRLPERLTAYVTSKAAVIAFTEAVSNELPPGVTINAIAPGAVPTTFMAEVTEVGAEAAGEALYRQVAEPAEVDMTPLRELVMYLASEASAWLSGRLVSARWERPDVLESNRRHIESSSRYRLRRIDDELFLDAIQQVT
jgi:3-oxoacyl-[acyl-carrier protein] reductase